MKRQLLLAFGLLAACFALPAAAQLDSSALYIGANAGRSHFTNVCSGAVETCKNRDTGGALFAGLQFSRYIALEGAARFFGHAAVDTSNVKANATELDGVLTFPLYRSFSLLGRAGVYHGVMKSDTKSVSKNGGTFGWGGQYDFDRAGALRLEYQRYANMGGGAFGATTHIDVVTLGLLFRFQ